MTALELRPRSAAKEELDREFVLRGQELYKREDNINWELGDLALEVETAYGENSIGKYAAAWGYEQKRVENARWLARMFPNSTRVESLSWTHHRAVAGRKDAATWLSRAAENGWSARKLESEVDRAESWQTDWEQDELGVDDEPTEDALNEAAQELVKRRQQEEREARENYTRAWNIMRRQIRHVINMGFPTERRYDKDAPTIAEIQRWQRFFEQALKVLGGEPVKEEVEDEEQDTENFPF